MNVRTRRGGSVCGGQIHIGRRTFTVAGQIRISQVFNAICICRSPFQKWDEMSMQHETSNFWLAHVPLPPLQRPPRQGKEITYCSVVSTRLSPAIVKQKKSIWRNHTGHFRTIDTCVHNWNTRHDKPPEAVLRGFYVLTQTIPSVACVYDGPRHAEQWRNLSDFSVCSGQEVPTTGAFVTLPSTKWLLWGS